MRRLTARGNGHVRGLPKENRKLRSAERPWAHEALVRRLQRDPWRGGQPRDKDLRGLQKEIRELRPAERPWAHEALVRRLQRDPWRGGQPRDASCDAARKAFNFVS
jgi:Txe/YoeB family toxin of Txe-Axe toxin-antitoxin module